MTTMRVTAEMRESAITELRKLLTPGSTVYVVQRHVSRSGMQRRLSLHVIAPKGYLHAGTPDSTAADFDLRDITILAGQAAGFTISDGTNGGNWELVVNGAGMDMHFHVVYSLSRTLFPDGFTGRNARNGFDGAPGYDRDGGYALNKVTI